MKIKIEGADATFAGKQVQLTALRLGMAIYNGRAEGGWYVFVLRPARGDERYRAIGHSGRKVWALCWHGHKRFMDALFAQWPQAKLRSTIASYDGEADYRAKVAHGQTKIGFDSTGRCRC